MTLYHARMQREYTAILKKYNKFNGNFSYFRKLVPELGFLMIWKNVLCSSPLHYYPD